MPSNPILKANTAKALPVVVLWLFAMAFLVILFLQESIPYEALLLDPDLATTTPWYVGILWGFSLLGWATATVAALGSGWICQLAGRAGATRMLVRGGAISALYLVDDLFQLGQRLAAFFDTTEAMFAIGWILVSAVWVLAERSELSRTRVELIATAIAAMSAAFIMSSVAPSLFNVGTQQAIIAASAAEFLGILAWAQYFLLTGADIVRSILINLRTQSEDSSSGVSQDGPDLGQPPTAVSLTPRERPKKPTPT